MYSSYGRFLREKNSENREKKNQNVFFGNFFQNFSPSKILVLPQFFFSEFFIWVGGRAKRAARRRPRCRSRRLRQQRVWPKNWNRKKKKFNNFRKKLRNSFSFFRILKFKIFRQIGLKISKFWTKNSDLEQCVCASPYWIPFFDFTEIQFPRDDHVRKMMCNSHIFIFKIQVHTQNGKKFSLLIM